MSLGPSQPDQNRHHATLPGPSSGPAAKWLKLAGRQTPATAVCGQLLAQGHTVRLDRRLQLGHHLVKEVTLHPAASSAACSPGPATRTASPASAPPGGCPTCVMLADAEGAEVIAYLASDAADLVTANVITLR